MACRHQQPGEHLAAATAASLQAHTQDHTQIDRWRTPPMNLDSELRRWTATVWAWSCGNSSPARHPSAAPCVR